MAIQILPSIQSLEYNNTEQFIYANSDKVLLITDATFGNNTVLFYTLQAQLADDIDIDITIRNQASYSLLIWTLESVSYNGYLNPPIGIIGPSNFDIYHRNRKVLSYSGAPHILKPGQDWKIRVNGDDSGDNYSSSTACIMKAGLANSTVAV